MRVRIKFDRPFYGMVFSKGHYRNANCVHVPSGLGQTQATFDISLQSCGMTASSGTGANGFTKQTPQVNYNQVYTKMQIIDWSYVERN